MSSIESFLGKWHQLISLTEIVDAEHHQMITDRLMKLETIIMPKPTFSVMVGLWLISVLLRAVGRSLADVKLEITGENDKHFFAQKAGDPKVYLLGLGRNKYFSKREDCFSQLAVVVADFHVCNPIILQLVERMNEDAAQGSYKPKGRGGWTKKWSIVTTGKDQTDQVVDFGGEQKTVKLRDRNLTLARLIRDALELNFDVDEIIKQSRLALDCWFAVESFGLTSEWDKVKDNDTVDSWWGVMFGKPELGSLPRFSVPRLVVDLAVVMGDFNCRSMTKVDCEDRPVDSPESIFFLETIMFWFDLSVDTEERYWANNRRAQKVQEAVNASQVADLDIFFIKSKTPQGQGFFPRGIWIEVEDSLSARELFRLKDGQGRPMFHVVVTKNRDDGKVAILTGGNVRFDLKPVLNRLTGHENVWDLHEWQYPMLINGGMRHHKATGLTRDQIVGYIKESATIIN